MKLTPGCMIRTKTEKAGWPAPEGHRKPQHSHRPHHLLVPRRSEVLVLAVVPIPERLTASCVLVLLPGRQLAAWIVATRMTIVAIDGSGTHTERE